MDDEIVRQLGELARTYYPRFCDSSASEHSGVGSATLLISSAYMLWVCLHLSYSSALLNSFFSSLLFSSLLFSSLLFSSLLFSSLLFSSKLRSLRTLLYNDWTRQFIKCQTNTSRKTLVDVMGCAMVSAQGNGYVRA